MSTLIIVAIVLSVLGGINFNFTEAKRNPLRYLIVWLIYTVVIGLVLGILLYKVGLDVTDHETVSMSVIDILIEVWLAFVILWLIGGIISWFRAMDRGDSTLGPGIVIILMGSIVFVKTQREYQASKLVAEEAAEKVVEAATETAADGSGMTWIIIACLIALCFALTRRI